MFYSDPHLAYPVRVDKPNPVFAKMLQQAIGGIEGEIRVMLQYLFQAWGFRGPAKYKDMLYNTGTEEIGHIEMLATAVAMNLEGAPTHLKDEIAGQNPTVAAVLGGMNPRHFLSTALAATAEDANGNPFNGSWVVASGNLVADMHANVAAETTGRLLVTRLWEMTDDPGMKDTLGFLIARDTMHQNQWLAVLEELQNAYPVPSDFSQTNEKNQFSYQYFVQSSTPLPEHARFTEGPSVDGKGQFTMVQAKPLGQIPMLAPAPNASHALVMEKNAASPLKPMMESPANSASMAPNGTNADSTTK
jgi:Mn-containing catalase